MKIVVLGSTGFIGAAVYEALKAKGLPIKPIATSSKAMRLDAGFCNWVKDDIDGADVVYLCAGRTGGVGRMASDPFSFVYSNVRIHMNVFEACVEAGVKRVVCIQSTTGYRNTAQPCKEEEYTQGDLHPAYFVPGNAHRFIYQLAQMHKGLDVVFFRPSNVYGPRNSFDPHYSHVIEATVRKVAEHQDPFIIWGTGKEVRDAVYIDDLAEAMTFGLECDPGGYNVASGEEMDVNEIVQTLLDYEGYNPKITHDTTKPTAINARRLDIMKMIRLGWMPKTGMAAGLGKTLEWYKSNVGK